MKKWIVVALLVGAGYFAFSRPRCGRPDTLECPAADLEEGVGLQLSAAEECPSAGYLCDETRSFQLARFPLDKGYLRVRVALPDFLDKQTAREVRAAVIEGIKAWDGHPFPLVVDVSAIPLRIPDVEVVWTEGLYNAALGLSTYSTQEDGKRLKYRSDGIAVVVPAEFTLGPRFLARMEQTGMHEMGHALGLKHSDGVADIMYPRLREDMLSPRLSSRDLHTVEALYSIPNGARIQ
jgi:hypothetical protein